MVGNDDGITEAEGESQILPGLPGVLGEPFPHVGAKDRVGAMADFRIGVEQAQGGVGDGDACPVSPSVGEQELAVLVVRARGASRYVYLVIVVFAGAFPKTAEFQRVISLYPGKAVGYVVDGARGVRRIRPTAQVREIGYFGGRNAGGDELALREYIGIVEAAGHRRLGACLVPIKEVRRIYRYQNNVLTGGDQNLIHHPGIHGPYVVE